MAPLNMRPAITRHTFLTDIPLRNQYLEGAGLQYGENHVPGVRGGRWMSLSSGTCAVATYSASQGRSGQTITGARKWREAIDRPFFFFTPVVK